MHAKCFSCSLAFSFFLMVCKERGTWEENVTKKRKVNRQKHVEEKKRNNRLLTNDVVYRSFPKNRWK